MRLLEEYKGIHGEYWEKNAKRSMEKFDDCTVKDGIVRWKSNDKIPPTDLLELWAHVGKAFDFEKTVQRRSIEDSEAIEEYCRQQAEHSLSPEERYEMEAAFGKGSTIVDIFTGRKIQL